MGCMDDQKETYLLVRNCFNVILDHSVSRIMCQEYMAAKSPTESTYNLIRNNLLESYTPSH